MPKDSVLYSIPRAATARAMEKAVTALLPGIELPTLLPAQPPMAAAASSDTAACASVQSAKRPRLEDGEEAGRVQVNLSHACYFHPSNICRMVW